MKLIPTILLVICLAACSDPKDIVLGQEPLKQILEKPDAFKRLSESDRSILVGYLMAQQMGRAFGGASAPDNVTGKTVGEVLTAATRWRAGMEEIAKAELQRKSERDARKAQAESERETIMTRIAAQVTVSVVDKKVIPKNPDRFQFNEYLKIDYSSAYEPAPDIGFENEFSRLGLITDVVKGLANQGKKSYHLMIMIRIMHFSV